MINFEFLNNKKILITGGAGFIGSALVRRLLKETNSKIFNIDKLGYASNLDSIEQLINSKTQNNFSKRYKLLKINLFDYGRVLEAIEFIKPNLIFHLAAETHVDRSIETPNIFIDSNIIGTVNLLNAALNHWENLQGDNKSDFRFLHISTDEVFGSLGESGFFNENTKYSPRSPYSASKAASDHFVCAWKDTYGLPTLITNCSNNFGPWQFPEKLIPLVILKVIKNQNIPIYGDGKNIRDWLYVEDHIDALILAISKGKPGGKYCIGGYGEHTNLDIIMKICEIIDLQNNTKNSFKNLATFVEDRPGHDKRYAINSDLAKKELNWHPKFEFKSALEKTVQWYIKHEKWCEKISKKAAYEGQRIGKLRK